MYQEQRRLATDLGEANAQLRAANLSFAKGLIATLDARDQYTAGHSAAVAIYARDIAERMQLGTEQAELAHLCGLVHDIGKIGLPAGLLEKPGALTLDERREMQRHSEIGERILANVDSYAEIAAIVRHHHERVDGQGYPDKLSGDEIPSLSRIIAVADAYNAMTSNRPYRDAMPSRVARLRLAQAVESQFDTGVVAAFEAILAGATEDYRTGRGAEFNLLPLSADETTSANSSDRRAVRECRRVGLIRVQVKARDCFGACSDAEFLKNVSNVDLGRGLGDHQRVRYLSVPKSSRYQLDDLPLARCQQFLRGSAGARSNPGTPGDRVVVRAFVQPFECRPQPLKACREFAERQ